MSSARLRFGHFEVREDLRQVFVDGEPAKLGARAFDVLLALIERRDQIVSKNDLLDIVWPKVVVEESNLMVHISALRKLLGHQAITTIPGRGYRFTAALADGQSLPGSPSAMAGPGVDANFAAANVDPNTKSNLPEALQPLIGREDDMPALGALVAQHRLVTIVGAGGMGKTQVALHLLHRQRGVDEPGVFWVELASLSDPLLVVSTIASALGIQTGSNDPLKGLVAALRPMKILVALDNAEHLIDEVARVVQAIIIGAPTVRVVVTSQVPLKHAGERIYRLGSLALPVHPVELDEAMTFGAVALFVERAEAADRHFALTSQNVETVIDICRHLDGMALAIELAAARVPLLGVNKLAQTLNERLRVLTGGGRGAPQRQQTLRAALEWSHGLLSQAEQVVFRRLGVFAGGFSLGMAQQVVPDAASEPPLDEWVVLDVLGSLVDRSLVVVDASEPPRYRLLESPRAFALDCLALAGEDADLRRRHARAVLARFVSIDMDCWAGGIAVDHALEALERDIDNARVAFAWSLTNEPASAIELAAPLSFALRVERYHEQRRIWEESAERLARGDLDLPLPTRARWTTWFSNFWFRKPAVGLAAARDAVAMCRRFDDPVGLYCALASLCATGGARKEKLAAMEEMRSLECTDWSARLQHVGARAQTWCDASLCDFGAAQASALRAISLAQSSGALNVGSIMEANLVRFALCAGHFERALNLGVALEARLRGTRFDYSLATVQVVLIAAQTCLGDLPSARGTAVSCWPLALRFDMQAAWTDNVALLAMREGRIQSAVRLLGYSTALNSKDGETRQLVEDRAAKEVEQAAREFLGSPTFECIKAEGAALRDADVAALAFGVSDA